MNSRTPHSFLLGTLASGMILASCGGALHDTDERAVDQQDTGQAAGIQTGLLIGSWEDRSPRALHFTLFADGSARSDNMATLLYQHWYIGGEQLFLVAKSIGNGTSSIDTLAYTIERLNERELVLKRADIRLELIRVSAGSNGASSDRHTLVVKGRSVLGHEARSFTPCGSDSSYWVSDPTGTLGERYDELTRNKAAYTPIYIEMEVEDRGRSREGFAADYAGNYEVRKILAIRHISADDCQ